jgi:uncharacterized protein YndB with AHSA1/START domain
MSGKLDANGVFSTERLIAFSRDKVFEAFSDATKLARWWGPTGFTNTFESFDFTPHGRWTFIMHGPDGSSYQNENVFLGISKERIVIRHDCAPFFTLTVNLSAVGEHTQLRWSQAFDDPEFAKKVAEMILPANEQNLDRLQAVLS